MSLDIKRAFKLPFGGMDSLTALIIGTLFSLPGAWLSAHHGSPTWVTILAFVGAVGLTGYGIRIMRQQFSDATATQLPSWTDNPVQMLLDTLCTWVGLLVAGLFFLGIGLVIFLVGSVAVLGGINSAGPGTYDLYAGLGAISVLIFVLFGMVPISLYASALTPHYAQENRFGAALEWRKIWRVVFGRFWALLLTLVLGLVAISLAQGVAGSVFVLVGAETVRFVAEAAVGFLGSVILSNLIAQQYAIARSQSNWK